MKKIIGILAFGLLLTNCTLPQTSDSKNRGPSGLFSSGAKALDEEDILESSSSKKLPIKQARLILDNDASFDSKLAMIQSATRSIKMAYYIFADDYSSSLLTYELLEAANKRNVKVELILDYLTNYKFLDLLTMLESQSQGRIQVKLYNRPSANILRDASFLTSACPKSQKPAADECSKYKWQKIEEWRRTNKDLMNDVDYFTGMLISGLYGKNALAAKTAVLMGQELDLEKLKAGSANTTAEQQKQLKEFLKLVYAAKVKGDLVSKIKVGMALSMYGDQLNPVLNDITGLLPIEQAIAGSNSGKDWEHLTDFLHQKILLVDGNKFQLGGRNIEDSYHMNPNPLVKKYNFIDTDFYAELTEESPEITAAFDRIWKFNPMLATLPEVRRHAPNDLIMNPKVFGASIQKCLPMGLDSQKLKNCMIKTSNEIGLTPIKDREQAAYDKLLENRNLYLTKYLPTKKYLRSWQSSGSYNDALSAEDVSQALVTYIENIPFNKDASPSRQVRLFGSKNEAEYKNGKYIHDLWVKGLANACRQSMTEGRKEVVLHSAYFLPPSNLISAFAKMMDGTWDCKNVKVTFITNSFDTTDLNIINVFAKHQMNAFFDIEQRKAGLFGSYNAEKAAQFEYYEYVKDPKQTGISLHTKLSVLGDDLIVGSANADVRSYYMDSNNGVYIRGAKGLVGDYLKYIESLKANPRVLINTTDFYRNTSREQLYAMDNQLVNGLLSKYKLESKFSPAQKNELIGYVQGVGKYCFEATQKILVLDYNQEGTDENQKRLQQQNTANEFNRRLQLF